MENQFMHHTLLEEITTKVKRKNGIDYLNHCAYMCVPNNYYNSTHAMGRN